MINSGFARCLSVSELSSYLKDLLENDQILNNLWVKGEVSNLKIAASGHIYFTLKDEQSCLKSVMFRSAASRMLFKISNGMELMVRGYISIYHKDGQYQLYVQEVHTLGLGDLHLAFEQLKAKLQQEGLFETNLKQTIPVLPSKIGIVTSLTGAVLHDIISVANRRLPGISFIIAPSAVQGVDAPLEIASAIEKLNRYTDVDLMIVARGGGSLEELWAFNTEIVARAIYNSKIPVISAVGHETDFTIADLAADKRAPTPSAAAEIAVPNVNEIQIKLAKLGSILEQKVTNLINTYRLKVEHLANSKAISCPLNNFNQYRQWLDYTERSLHLAVNNLNQGRRSDVARMAGKLDNLSPLAILKRGYALCKNEDGILVTDSRQVDAGSLLEVTFDKGSVKCTVLQHVGSDVDE